MPEYINEALCARALIATMKDRLGMEPPPETQMQAEKMLHSVLVMHCAIAGDTYLEKLRASVEAVELVFRTMRESSGEVAALLDQVFDPIAGESSVQ